MAEEIENSPLLTGPGCKVVVEPKIKIQSPTIGNCKDTKTVTKTDISLETNVEQKKELNNEYDKSKNREQRGTWKHPLDFLFSCISVTVGLGNVWRFPYLCYKNGGGVFLIIYLTTMIFCGIPIVLQEVIIGQYLGEGGSTIIGKVCPILKGVGMSTMVMVTYYNIYYCVIISWSLYYFIASFATIPDVPWNTCNGWWNSEKCLLPRLQPNFSTKFEANITNITGSINQDKVAAVTEFWRNRVLQINEGIEYGLGNIQWELAGTLLLGWLIVYAIVCRGLHQSGYVVWVTALSPYAIMIVLLIRALTLDGAEIGLKAYITVDWKYFMQGRTWLDASTQIFFDYSVGNGALAALGSYNKFNHNCLRDAVIACLVCTCTCLSAGLLVFATLGNMAYLQNKTVDEVATSGPGLVFLSYPELVLNLPASFLWSILFFSMLLILGIDTAFCSVESLITGIVDKWNKYLRSRRKLVASLVCVTCYLLGLPMVFRGGMYLFQIVDFYAASGMALLWICFFETIAISWCYGTDKLIGNVEEMIGQNRNILWLNLLKLLCFCWKILTPTIILGIFFYYIYSYTPVTYGENYHYPKWAEVIGLLISFSSMVWVPFYALYYCIRGFLNNKTGTVKERMWKCIKMGLTPEHNENIEPFSNVQQQHKEGKEGNIFLQKLNT
jgi:solute carrier family 6 GABA transporter-like protein 1